MTEAAPETSTLPSLVSAYIQRSKEIGKCLFDFPKKSFYQSTRELMETFSPEIRTSPLFSPSLDIRLEMESFNHHPALYISSPKDTHKTVIRCIPPETDGGIPLATITQVGKDNAAVSITTRAIKRRLNYQSIEIESRRAKDFDTCELGDVRAWIKLSDEGKVMLEDSSPADVIKNIPSSFITSILKSIWSNTPITHDPLMQSLFQWKSPNSSY